MRNWVFIFKLKNIILLLQFNRLYQGPRPTSAICRLVKMLVPLRVVQVDQALSVMQEVTRLDNFTDDA